MPQVSASGSHGTSFASVMIASACTTLASWLTLLTPASWLPHLIRLIAYLLHQHPHLLDDFIFGRRVMLQVEQQSIHRVQQLFDFLIHVSATLHAEVSFGLAGESRSP